MSAILSRPQCVNLSLRLPHLLVFNLSKTDRYPPWHFLKMSLIRHSVESPSVVDPQWNILYEICTQSAEMRLAVSGGQPLFTRGLLMFALSLVDFLSLLWSLSTNIEILYFC